MSWRTQDTGRDIYDWQNPFEVHVVDPRDGTDYPEKNYDSELDQFAGRDFFELLADMNRRFLFQRLDSEETRCAFDQLYSKDWKSLSEDERDKKRGDGISLWYSWIEPESKYEYVRRKHREEDMARRKSSWKYLRSPIILEHYENWKKFAGYGKFPKYVCG